MNNTERRDKGLAYKADSMVLDEMLLCKRKLHVLNSIDPWEIEKIIVAAKDVISSSNDLMIVPPFYCEYGTHIKLGQNFFANYNCTMIDVAQITIGDNCLLGPNVSLYTAGHPVHQKTRNSGYEYGKAIIIGDNCEQAYIASSSYIEYEHNIKNAVVDSMMNTHLCSGKYTTVMQSFDSSYNYKTVIKPKNSVEIYV